MCDIDKLFNAEPIAKIIINSKSLTQNLNHETINKLYQKQLENSFFNLINKEKDLFNSF